MDNDQKDVDCDLFEGEDCSNIVKSVNKEPTDPDYCCYDVFHEAYDSKECKIHRENDCIFSNKCDFEDGPFGLGGRENFTEEQNPEPDYNFKCGIRNGDLQLQARSCTADQTTTL